MILRFQANASKRTVYKLRMTGEFAALLGSAKSFLAHPVFLVSLLAPVEEESPHLKKRPVVQDPAEGEEYVVDAVLAHRKKKRRGQGGSP